MMKKINILFLLFFCLISIQTSEARHTFAPSSVMSSGKWVKMRVSESGIYKVTYQDIVNQGLDPNSVRVYGYGGAMLNEDFMQPRIDDLPQVAVYKGGDYILFYAQGPISWEYDYSSSSYKHTVNPYSSYGYYFLASGVEGSQEKTIPTLAEVNSQGSVNITTFTDYALHNKELVNLVAVSGRNGSGRTFYGEEFTPSSRTRTINFTIPNVVRTTDARLDFNGAVYSSVAGSGFKVAVGSTSNTFNTSRVPDSYTKGTIANGIFNFFPSSSQTNVTVTLNNANAAVKGWLNYIRITAERELIMTGKVMFFGNSGANREVTLANYILRGANTNIKIWDITVPDFTTEIPTNFNALTGEMSFIVQNSTLTDRKFVAVDMTNSFSSVAMLGAVDNQNLHALPNHDFVIVSHSDFLIPAQKLAQAHRNIDNMSVLVVTPEQVYNEFSSGTPDATAIRAFMKMFYDRYNAGIDKTRTKYLLLFGDGSFDNRQILSNPDNNNKILTFQSYNSESETRSYVIDDYFGFLDDNEGRVLQNDKLDIGIGRFPVNTLPEAEAVVEKNIRYMENKSKGVWKNQICYLADDADKVSDFEFMVQSNTLADTQLRMNPDFQIMKLYLDAYKQKTTSAGQSYPEAREKFLNSIKKGLLAINYIGHGGNNGLGEKTLISQDVIDMYNENMGLWITATCDFSRFDSGRQNIGELAFLNPRGAAIALISTTRTVYQGPNYTLNTRINNNLFSKDENGNRLRLGDIMRESKKDLVGDSNKLSFALLGNPALLLTYPTFKVAIDSINSVDANVEPMTIGALSRVTLKGHIADDDSNQMTDFNGIVSITVFDKEEDITTLNNDGFGHFIYKDRSALFSGQAKVINGKFTTTFMVPKDINYSLGKGRTVYYAYDDNNNYEAHGHYENFIIGGSSNENIDDNEGPEIEMYLNTPAFVSGDRVNSSPLLVAHISDENGINVIGNGIGRDLTIMLNDREWINVNDHFQLELGSYQSGVVQYKLNDIPDGKHSLTLRAWDLLNNSSSKSIDFTVQNNLPVNIIDAYCYPNPASHSTTFVLKHDRPDEIMDVSVFVYDLTGKEIWTFNSDFYTMDNSLIITEWDLKMNSGQKLQNGMYLFKVEVTTKNSKLSTKTKKIIINTQ